MVSHDSGVLVGPGTDGAAPAGQGRAVTALPELRALRRAGAGTAARRLPVSSGLAGRGRP